MPPPSWPEEPRPHERSWTVTASLGSVAVAVVVVQRRGTVLVVAEEE